ncbi:MotA/TolQ/ExbB proton channel family protein [Acidaminococcus fermentans]|uniref:MotA/TolQ/ExbB proton channel family protein n=1 Tax=Acidaminococcus fermentans TaxID=905 RepID=UPI0024204ED9|nr:MotA/TolQ/ExbB proton channel family protein [Acidaminococcus fermentans]
MENFISYRAERALDKFEQNLPYLNIIVTLALVLGLLGTVTRMMGAFNHITQRMENPMGSRPAWQKL